jgi:hypothetical protein
MPGILLHESIYSSNSERKKKKKKKYSKKHGGKKEKHEDTLRLNFHVPKVALYASCKQAQNLYKDCSRLMISRGACLSRACRGGKERR